MLVAIYFWTTKHEPVKMGYSKERVINILGEPEIDYVLPDSKENIIVFRKVKSSYELMLKPPFYVKWYKAIQVRLDEYGKTIDIWETWNEAKYE